MPGVSLRRAMESARDNPQLLMVLTSHGGHLGWCERSDPRGSPAWIERVTCGFLEAALDIRPADTCEAVGCTIFD